MANASTTAIDLWSKLLGSRDDEAVAAIEKALSEAEARALVIARDICRDNGATQCARQIGALLDHVLAASARGSSDV